MKILLATLSLFTIVSAQAAASRLYPAGSWTCDARTNCPSDADFTGLNNPYATCDYESDPQPTRERAYRDVVKQCRNDRHDSRFGNACRVTSCQRH